MTGRAGAAQARPCCCLQELARDKPITPVPERKGFWLNSYPKPFFLDWGRRKNSFSLLSAAKAALKKSRKDYGEALRGTSHPHPPGRTGQGILTAGILSTLPLALSTKTALYHQLSPWLPRPMAWMKLRDTKFPSLPARVLVITCTKNPRPHLSHCGGTAIIQLDNGEFHRDISSGILVNLASIPTGSDIWELQ